MFSNQFDLPGQRITVSGSYLPVRFRLSIAFATTPLYEKAFFPFVNPPLRPDVTQASADLSLNATFEYTVNLG